MKFGIRKPSLKRRLAARTSWKRMLHHNMGLKAPRGWGWLTNPKKAAYNRIYNRTSISIDKLFNGRPKRNHRNNSSYSYEAQSESYSGLYIVAFIFCLFVFRHNLALFFVLLAIATIGYCFVKFEKVEKEKAHQAARSQRLSQLFGHENGKMIENGILWVGASKEMVEEMFGKPMEIEDKYLMTKSRCIYKYYQVGINRFLLRVTIDDGFVTRWDDKR